MLLAMLALAAINLICIMALLLRKSAASAPDPRLAQLPDQLARIDARGQALDTSVRTSLDQLRTNLAEESRRTREEITRNIAELSQLLNTGLNAFRNDNKQSDNLLRAAIQEQLNTLSQRLNAFTSERPHNTTPTSASPSTPSSPTSQPATPACRKNSAPL